MIKTYTKPEITEVLSQVIEQHCDRFNAWLERGDGIAVYENRAGDHTQLGHQQFVSYGGTAAQIEDKEPPQRMPDIGSHINWAYQLVGTYKGELLDVPDPCGEYSDLLSGGKSP